MSDESAGALGADFADSVTSADGNYAFIGAIHTLVSSKTEPRKADLILAAACHAVRHSDKTVSEVVTVVNQIWPGARTDAESVGVALELGQEIGLLVRKAALGETWLWSLTGRGVEDVDRQADWVKDLRARTRQQIIDRARDGLGLDIDHETAELWLERLLQALIQGIQSAQDAYFGRVDQVVGNRLVPKGIDQRKVFAALEDSRVNPVTIDFLKTVALSALDPLDPFGNELVSLVTTGCVLHSYVAGRDAAETLRRLGNPSGQRALIDTPVLVDLVGPGRLSSQARFLIGTAVASDWEVIVCEHSLDELAGLIEREIPKVKQSFTEAHERGVKTEWYASLVEDQLTSYCVEVLRDGTYSSLDEMVRAAENLSSELADLGVIVRPHGNEGDEVFVERARVALQADLDGSGSGRSATAVERDANSMATVWRRRRRQTGGEWPGGWIITADRHIAPAYRALDRHDSIPLTLSLARWGTLLAVTVPPAEVVELAEAAATQLVEEAMWLLPSRFPSAIAMSLAKQLSPDSGGSDLDIRYAQLTLDGSLDEAGESRSAAALASDVLEARIKRTGLIQAEGLAEARGRQAEAELRAAAAQAHADTESASAVEAHRRASEAGSKLETVEDELAWQRVRSGRIVRSLVASFIGLIGVYGTYALGQPFWVSLVAWLALLTMVVGGVRWAAKSEAKLGAVLIGAVIEAAAVVATVVELVNDVMMK